MMLAAFGSLLFIVVRGLVGPILMLVAAKHLMTCPSKWPAHVIRWAAVYGLLMNVPNIMINPLMQNMGIGLRNETYFKVVPYLSPLSFIVGLASAIAVLTVCKRLATMHRPSTNRDA